MKHNLMFVILLPFNLLVMASVIILPGIAVGALFVALDQIRVLIMGS